MARWFTKGHTPSNFADRSGQRYGRLVVVARAGSTNNKAAWMCLCDCGKEKRLTGDALQKGQQTCGCKTGFTHPQARHMMTASAEHTTWSAMLGRCTNPNNEAFSHYGGRGIRVCQAWSSFDVFFSDMGRKPSPKHSIDRIDPDGDYEPGNCRWATSKEQARNKRYHRRVGDELLVEVADRTGIKIATLDYRLRNGVPLDKPVGGDVFLTHGGITLNLKGWASRLGVARSTLSMRRSRGLPVESILKESRP